MARENPDSTIKSFADAPAVWDSIVDLPLPLALHYGNVLENARVAYRMTGPPTAPIVAVLGGISAHRVLDGPSGWWPNVVGVNRGVDTRRFRVLGIDYLGGYGDSSTPNRGSSFPPLSSYDQAQVLMHALRHLGAPTLHAIVGASYGGMVALAFAARHPEAVDRIIVVSAAHKAQALSTAWRSIQRQIVREAIARGDGPAGLKLARALAMATYRSQAEFAMRFSGPAVRDADRFRFPVEAYLFARGDDYVQKHRAESFLALSESIDLHDVDPAQVATPATLIAVREDQLVPIADMQALAAGLTAPHRLVEINSIFGHDAFLKEAGVLNPLLDTALTEPKI